MSRICVKNLPKHVKEDRLRKFFSAKGVITDAKLMRIKEGKSRQFAFIGFRTEREAQEATKYYDRSFLDTCRISCEIARKVGDLEIPRPWSRHSKKEEGEGVGCEEKRKKEEREGGAKSGSLEVEDESGDVKLHEFLEVMQPRAKSKLWANDAVVAPVAEKIGKSRRESEEKSGAEKIGKTKKESEQKTVLVGMEEAEKGAKKNDKRNIAKDDVVSDMDYFKSRVKTEWLDSKSSEEDDNEEEEEEEKEFRKVNEKEQIKVHEEEDERRGILRMLMAKYLTRAILHPLRKRLLATEEESEAFESGRLFVRNLPFTATEEEPEEAFSKFGDAQVHLVIDKETNRSKGFAYVLSKLPECAERADDSASQASKPTKKQREDKRKASEASGDTRAWNSLCFMHPDTVVENIAWKYGVSKGDLLDREADDLAVQIALGETQVIAETNKSLTNAGINVESLENFAAGKTDGVKSSNHVILVKNLPYGSTDGELAKMFGEFGKSCSPTDEDIGLGYFS